MALDAKLEDVIFENLEKRSSKTGKLEAVQIIDQVPPYAFSK